MNDWNGIGKYDIQDSWMDYQIAKLLLIELIVVIKCVFGEEVGEDVEE